MKHFLVLVFCVLTAMGLLAQKPAKTPLVADPKVDLDRHLGEWYEIARRKDFFWERSMVGIKLNFTKRKGNTLKEVFQGRKKTLSGKLFSIRTHITFYKPGKFKDPFGLKHVVLYIDDGYQNILVGTANRRFLWILSRQPQIDTETYNLLLAKAVALGYNIDKIRLTPQPMAVHAQPSF